MSAPRLGSQTVTALRKVFGDRDDLGLPAVTWIPAGTYPGSSVQPLSSYEQASGGTTDQGWSKWKVLIPGSPDITSADRITSPGVPDLEVDGDVMPYFNSGGQPDHVEFLGTRWTG